MSYVVYFEFDKMLLRLPVNPEEINESNVQAVEKFGILKLGQIAVPTHMELREFTFEAELPHKEYSYVQKPEDFISAYSFLKILKEVRDKLLPIRFIYGQDTNNDGKINSTGESITVLIEGLEISEKAGEEGDKYVKFNLIEFREYGIRYPVDKKGANNPEPKETSSPKSNGYHIVQSGDSLWSIAKRYYGSGSKYNIIYHANKDKIKNPNLILIGWKLKVPDKSEFSKYSSSLPKTITKQPTPPKFTHQKKGTNVSYMEGK